MDFLTRGITETKYFDLPHIRFLIFIWKNEKILNTYRLREIEKPKHSNLLLPL